MVVLPEVPADILGVLEVGERSLLIFWGSGGQGKCRRGSGGSCCGLPGVSADILGVLEVGEGGRDGQLDPVIGPC